MKKLVLALITICILTAIQFAPPVVTGVPAKEQPPAKQALIAKLNGPVSPVMARFALRVLERAADQNAELVVFQLDTPGGLVESMRLMVQGILASKTPVVVFVSPQGARAASAGVMITLSAHVAAMAPGTNIGAASVVSAGGKDVGGTMGRKVTNDMIAFVRSVADKHGRNADWAEKAVRYAVSLPAIEAAAEGVVDVVAPDLPALLQWTDGRKVKMESGTRTLATADLEMVEVEPGWRDRVLAVIANPSLAYLLLMLGILGIYLELSHPGTILPGAVGTISILLALFAMQTLSISVTGLLLIILGVVLFIIELKVVSYGLLSLGGIACLFFGSIMLFESPDGMMPVSWSVILPTVGAVSAFFVSVAWLVFRAQFRRPVTGREGLVGQEGRVMDWNGDAGRVFIRGEIWKAVSDDQPAPGNKVKVTASEGLTLTVQPAPDNDEEV